MNVENPKVTINEYKGSPLIVLDADSRFPFQFGLKKAKLIIENLESIRRFVASEGKEI